MKYFRNIAFGLTTSLVLGSVMSWVQPVPKASMERGGKIYMTYCIACHQVDGSGVPRMNPPLIQTEYVLGEKERLINIVLKGLKGGEIEIDGEDFENPMASHDFLKDQEIADVLTYVRNSFGNSASLVKPDEVAAVRKKLKK